MGVDAQMLVRSIPPLPESAVLHLSYRLCEAFGHEHFSIVHPGNKYGWATRHALSIVESYDQDGPTLFPRQGEQFIEVHLRTRYYGMGYERGNLPLILGVADWLERNIRHARILYGGDSSGVIAAPLTSAHRELLLAHFCSVGHVPYATFGGSNETGPSCPLCKEPTHRFGWGKSYGMYACLGCDWKVETRDGGITFTEGERRCRNEWFSGEWPWSRRLRPAGVGGGGRGGGGGPRLGHQVLVPGDIGGADPGDAIFVKEERDVRDRSGGHIAIESRGYRRH